MLPAPTKLTPKDKAEILRRRASGEGIRSIARDFGVAHQTVSKVVKQARERAELESQRQTGLPVNAVPKADLFVHRGTDKRKNAKPPFVFESLAERDAYWEQRRLVKIPEGLADSNDVRCGRLTSDERRRGLIIRQ
jgi:transposase-like protein